MSKIDEDLLSMTREQLIAELMRYRKAFRQELNHKGNHRCWLNLLQALEGRSIAPIDIPKETFIRNCNRYYDRNTKVKK